MVEGRAFDNIFVERLWRSVKYEEVYLKDYATVKEAIGSLGAYFRFYNERRPHQALGYQTPYHLYTGTRTQELENQGHCPSTEVYFSTLKKFKFCLDRGVHLNPSHSLGHGGGAHIH